MCFAKKLFFENMFAKKCLQKIVCENFIGYPFT